MMTIFCLLPLYCIALLYVLNCDAFLPAVKNMKNLLLTFAQDEKSAEFHDESRGQNLRTQIFCNIELNCEHLEAVGFDMDFTLAQYNEAFDLLAFNGAKEKLFKELGYPAEILQCTYSSDRFRRGILQILLRKI